MRKEKELKKKRNRNAETKNEIDRNIQCKYIAPKTKNQANYCESILKNPITICSGFAGSGKSYLALGIAIKLLIENPLQYKKIVIIRPYIMNNSEKFGALPGDLSEKVLPFTLAIKDNLESMMSPAAVTQFLERIEFAVLSTCRGRSFKNSIVIVEEAQNIAKRGGGMELILTRVDDSSKLIISGDTDQLDIPKEECALLEFKEILKDVKGIGIIELNDPIDIQRNPLIRDILLKIKEFRNKNK